MIMLPRANQIYPAGLQRLYHWRRELLSQKPDKVKFRPWKNGIN